MVILCDGMVRSGSTWSFNVVRNLLTSDPTRKVHGIYSESPAVLAAGIHPRPSHLVIKSHVLSPLAHDLCCSNRVQAIYTWRNPIL